MVTECSDVVFGQLIRDGGHERKSAEPAVARAGGELLARWETAVLLEETDAFELEIKQLIVESLLLEDVRPAEIDSTAPLFVTGLGLDSIDALELAMAIGKRYGVRFSASDAAAAGGAVADTTAAQSLDRRS